MTSAPSLRTLWALLGERPAEPDSVRVLSIDGCPGAWAALDEMGNPGVLVAMSVDTPGRALRAVSSNSVGLMKARAYPTTVAGKQTRGLLVSCTASDVSDAFAGFVEHFVGQLTPDCDVGQLLLSCVDEFRRLLQDSGLGVSNPVVGLLGELVVLERLTAMWAEAWRTWGRPGSERHDFRNGSVALEVKSSLRSALAEPLVHISASDQLVPPSGGRLFLAWFRFEHDPAGAVSLPRLVDAVRPRLPADGQESLDAAVRMVVGSSGLPDRRYSIGHELTFDVHDEFPAIVPNRFVRGSVDPGVTHLSYEINLSFVQGQALPFHVAAGALQGSEA